MFPYLRKGTLLGPFMSVPAAGSPCFRVHPQESSPFLMPVTVVVSLAKGTAIVLDAGSRLAGARVEAVNPQCVWLHYAAFA